MKYNIGEKYLIALADGRDAAITITNVVDDMYAIHGRSCCGMIHEVVTEQFLDENIVRGAV